MGRTVFHRQEQLQHPEKLKRHIKTLIIKIVFLNFDWCKKKIKPFDPSGP